MKKELSTFDLSMIVISLVIGMGIFRSSVEVANAASSPAIFFSAWVAGGIIALFGALTFAEIGSRFPVTGGYYKVFSYCYHPSIAFTVNSIALISNAASLSAVALVGVGYLTSLLPPEFQTEFAIQMIALTTIIVFLLVNFTGFKMSVRTQNFLMMAKIGIVLFLCLGIFYPSQAAPPPVVMNAPEGFGNIVRAFGAALIAVSFTYGGYQQSINFGAEVRRPAKTVPKAIFIGIAVIIGLYFIINYAYYNVLGYEGIVYNAEGVKSKNDLAARHVGAMFGPDAYNIMSLLLFFAVLGYVNVGLMSNPRVMYAMAEDKVLPDVIKKVNRKTQVLTVALPVFAAVAIVTLFFSTSFDKIVNWVIFLDSVALASTAGSIFVLRKRTRHLDNTGIYKMKLFPVMPVIYILAYIFIAVNCFISDPKGTSYGLGLFAVLFILYFIIHRKKKKNPSDI